MSSSPVHTSHEERTSHEPRDSNLHTVKIEKIDQVNKSIRLFRLGIQDRINGVKFLPGQWLDVHIPTLPKAGGFTITSTPSAAQGQAPYLELAIQHSPRNPPAAWLWREPESLMGEEVLVRVGGSFVWPPEQGSIPKRVVFVAGGVGINPLISIVSHMHETGTVPEQTTFMYATKNDSAGDEDQILFLSRLKAVSETFGSERFRLELYLTGAGQASKIENEGSSIFRHRKRIAADDLERAMGDAKTRKNTWVYVCGPQHMTDSFVDCLSKLDNTEPSQILCEKWW